MSINVTVHGNPISIRRGRMVAIDADKEFELRRKIRLQQVRQQSKEIAEEVRNRVRKEKNKQLSKIEKEANRDLKKKQERKLSTLKKQYQDCLEEFGAAYRDADKQPDTDEIIGKLSEKNRYQAELRGKNAIEKQKEEKEQQEKKSKQLIENKKEVRNIENLRSKLVSSLNKKSPFKSKKRKKSVTDIVINGVTTVLTDESDVDYNSDIENLSVLEEYENISLDSEGNSIYSNGHESTKENDKELKSERKKSSDRQGSKSMYLSQNDSYNGQKQLENIDKKLLTIGEKPDEELIDRITCRSQRNLVSPDQIEADDMLRGFNYSEPLIHKTAIISDRAKKCVTKCEDRDHIKPRHSCECSLEFAKRVHMDEPDLNYDQDENPTNENFGIYERREKSKHINFEQDLEPEKQCNSSYDYGHHIKKATLNSEPQNLHQDHQKFKTIHEHRGQGKSTSHNSEQEFQQKNSCYDEETPSQHRSMHISDQIQKSFREHKGRQKSLDISTSPDQFRNNKRNPDELQNKARLHSGLDVEEPILSCYCGKNVDFCIETSCPALLSQQHLTKTQIKSSKMPRKQRGKNTRNANARSTSMYRKTIISARPPGHFKDSSKSSEKPDTYDYHISDNGTKKLRSPAKCVWPQSPLCKKASPRKVRCKSPRIICPRAKESSLPYVQTTTVIPETIDSQDSTVRYYDHFNRFSKETNHPTLVQKISEESIQVCPPSNEERQYRDIMKIRDEEARIRGNRALEKNKIHRDYQQLMEELPLLQRQERLASMATHNPAIHMSDERYQELERKKQNRMENIFENLQTKSSSLDIPIITIKSIRKSPPSTDMKQPYKTLDVSENGIPVLNVGRWDNLESNNSSTTHISPVETTTDVSLDKEQTLANLLKRVNKQREILLKEAATLPSFVNLKNVLNEEELLKLLGKTAPQTKILVETGTSPLITKELKEPIKKTKKTKSVASKTSSKRTAATTSSSDTSVEVPQQKIKKGKCHKKIKVLIKEEATQTTPSVQKSTQMIPKKEETEKKEQILKKHNKKEEATQTTPSCPNLGLTTCLCPKHKCQPSVQDIFDDGEIPLNNGVNSSTDSTKLCEIIIKTAEETNVQVSQHTTPRETIKSSKSKDSDESHKKDSKQKQQNIVKIKIKESQDKDSSIPKNFLEMSTSTSYMSPPIDVFGKVISKPSIPCPCKPLSEKSSNRELLQPQKQQTNIDNLVRVERGSKELNPRLIKYIKRLLSMSRQSIDELTISSVSDISTPQDSVVQAASNVARDKLHSVMEHFNLSVDDIKNYLSCSSLSISDVSLENVQDQEIPNRGQQGGVHFTEQKIYHQYIDPIYEESFGEKSIVPTVTPKQYTSVSTATDPDIYIQQGSSKISSATTTSDENEIRKHDQYRRIRLRSPDKSPPRGIKISDSSTGKDASTSTDPELPVRLRSRSQSPIDPSREHISIEKDKYTYVSDSQNKFTSEEKYIYPSTSSEHQAVSTKELITEPDSAISVKKSPKRLAPKPPKENSPKSIHSQSPLKSPSSKLICTRSPVKTSQKQTPVESPAKITASALKLAVPEELLAAPYEEEVWRQPEKFLEFVRKSLGMTVAEFSELGFQEMFSRHMELTEYCHDRIRSLMDLIEKVRNDKLQIYTPSPVDQSMTLTSYLELPQEPTEEVKVCPKKEYYDSIKDDIEKEISGGSASSISQETIDEYLLGIEKKEVPRKLEKRKKLTYEEQVQDIIDEGIQTNNDTQESFVPMLQGIPKYSEVVSTSKQHPSKYIKEIIQHLKQRPPPSLLRANMRGQTDVIPHELSTIVEAETMVSSRNTSLHHVQTPDEKKFVSTSKDFAVQTKIDCSCGDDKLNIESQNLEIKYSSPLISEHSGVASDSGDYITISPERSISSDKESKENIKVHRLLGPRNNMNTSSTSTQEVVLKSSLSGVRPLSDTTTDSPDELESMLRKFKLEWAIALVRKTEQALALSSSSSASDIMQPNGIRPDNNSTDISVRETYKRIYKKLASTSGSETERSQIFLDISQHFKEFHDISEIPGAAERTKSQQRTSTPVQHSKSTESKKSFVKDSLFKNDSELSSVRNSSDDNLFLSIPNVTLNTTNCSLNKPKK